MFLGAACYQVPSIKYALSKGYYTITCDNRKENTGHKIADKSYFVCTRDKEAVLKIAKNEKIDGIISFGSDISMPTAAYVSDILGLSGNPVETIRILTDKSAFRAFLDKSGIQKTSYKSFEATEIPEVKKYILTKKLPLVIKPVDSSGSKGVGFITTYDDFDSKIDNAFKKSFSNRIIIEEYSTKTGKQICGDGYFENGKVKYIFFGDGHYYDNGLHLAPWGETFPSTHSKYNLEKVKDKIELILNNSGYIKGPFNHDVLINNKGDVFIVEIGPRSGGNFIPKAISLKYGVDMIAAGVELALDKDYIFESEIKENSEYYACYTIHSYSQKGKLTDFKISEELIPKVFELNQYLNRGDDISPFIQANYAVGNAILRFETMDEMKNIFNNINAYFTVNIQNGHDSHF